MFYMLIATFDMWNDPLDDVKQLNLSCISEIRVHMQTQAIATRTERRSCDYDIVGSRGLGQGNVWTR